METTTMGYKGTTRRILSLSFIPSGPSELKVSRVRWQPSDALDNVVD